MNNNPEKKYIVITSVNKIPKQLKNFVSESNWNLIYIGDKRSPKIESSQDIRYFSIKDQLESSFSLQNHLPFNHYCRKNLGYLHAIQEGGDIIAETDDDNFPYSNWGEVVSLQDDSLTLVKSPKFVNVYEFFSQNFIWPRGFPLSKLNSDKNLETSSVDKEEVYIWQGLANGEPDVDAIFRLVFGLTDFEFNTREPIALGKGVYSPINSQNTIWKRKAYPFLYLPITVSFRFTDILRGYIAKRGLESFKGKVAYTQPTVYQERNPHDLLVDFEKEIPCYLQAEKTVNILEQTKLVGRPLEDLAQMYKNLENEGIVKQAEIEAVDAWVRDIKEIYGNVDGE